MKADEEARRLGLSAEGLTLQQIEAGLLGAYNQQSHWNGLVKAMSDPYGTLDQQNSKIRTTGDLIDVQNLKIRTTGDQLDAQNLKIRGINDQIAIQQTALDVVIKQHKALDAELGYYQASLDKVINFAVARWGDAKRAMEEAHKEIAGWQVPVFPGWTPPEAGGGSYTVHTHLSIDGTEIAEVITNIVGGWVAAHAGAGGVL